MGNIKYVEVVFKPSKKFNTLQKIDKYLKKHFEEVDTDIYEKNKIYAYFITTSILSNKNWKKILRRIGHGVADIEDRDLNEQWSIKF